MTCQKSAAVIWDLQNVRVEQNSIEQIQQMMENLGQISSIQHKWICAHWRRESLKVEQFFLERLKFCCQNAIAAKDKRNNADACLIQHVEENVLPKCDIDIVVLVSGDGDFKKLVEQLKLSGKCVIVVPRFLEKASRRLLQVADYAVGIEELMSRTFLWPDLF